MRDNDMSVVPTRFWQSMSLEEFDALAKNDGWLNAIQCARLWRMTERNTRPPLKLQIFLKRDEVEKLAK